MKMKREKV